ncbi:hypothetical protein [Mesorhizobium sp. M0847]|uniref:hypothetical protein n=1 Tax=unclassified Mesorhizobium TaxID=325217 RepID=UPI0033357B05
MVGSHPRRLHYNLVSRETPILRPNGEPYQNTENDWKYFASASLSARYLRLIPDGALSDARNDPPIIHAGPAATGTPSFEVYGRGGAGLQFGMEPASIYPPFASLNHFDACQEYLVEVWIEKSTMNDVLVPLAQTVGFNLVPGTGETSEVLARLAVERAVQDRRPMRILYVSDFDPGGRSMPVALARKIEYWVRDADLDLDITLQPIVLTPEQCEAYRLPRIPLKQTERRAAKFEERFGSGATELDALEALHPGVLATIVRSEVERYLDPTLPARVREAKWSIERNVRNFRAEVLSNYDIASIESRYNAAFDGFKAEVLEIEAETETLWPEIAEEIEEQLPEIEPEDLPKPRASTPPATPLFDSRRDYVDQIDHYRAWQGKGGDA